MIRQNELHSEDVADAIASGSSNSYGYWTCGCNSAEDRNHTETALNEGATSLAARSSLARDTNM